MTIEEELTYIAKTVVLEPQKLKGSNSRNKITDLGNGYLLKEYISVEKCQAEYIAAALVGECLAYAKGPVNNPANCHIVVPKIIRIGERTNLIQKFEGFVEAYELINSADSPRGAQDISTLVNIAVAHYLRCTYIGYTDLFSVLENPGLNSFEMHLVRLQDEISKKHDVVQSKVGTDKSEQIQKAILKSLSRQSWSNRNTTILHRDLHLSNILVKPDLSEVAIIDFEHSLLGPLEYELQNSVVFNDCKSLDVFEISGLLFNCGVGVDPDVVSLQSWVFLWEQLASLS